MSAAAAAAAARSVSSAAMRSVSSAAARSVSSAAMRSVSSAAMARSPLSFFLTRRLFSHPICLRSSPLAGVAHLRVSSAALSHVSVSMASPGADRSTTNRCWVNRSGDSEHFFKSVSGAFRSPLLNKVARKYPGFDCEHWIIIIDKPGGEGATSQQMIDCYIKTAAKILGSEEEAKKKIYNVSFEGYFGFGCEVDLFTSFKFKGLPEVLSVKPDYYVDVENKDYGAELFVNGDVVRRSPERQRRVEQCLLEKGGAVTSTFIFI